jgi:hypothetical protein
MLAITMATAKESKRRNASDAGVMGKNRLMVHHMTTVEVNMRRSAGRKPNHLATSAMTSNNSVAGTSRTMAGRMLQPAPNRIGIAIAAVYPNADFDLGDMGAREGHIICQAILI